MVAIKKTTVVKKKRSAKKHSAIKNARIKKRSSSKVPIHTVKQKPVKKDLPPRIPEDSNHSSEHDYMVRKMLMESSPKKQRAMLRQCILRLHKVIAACKPRTIGGTLALLFFGAIIGVVALLSFVYITKSNVLTHLVPGTNTAQIDGVSIRVEEEIDPSFGKPLVRSAPDNLRDVDFQKFWEVWQYIENDFVPPPEKNDGGVSIDTEYGVTREDLVNGAVKGLTFATKDRYTHFFLPKDATNFENEVIKGEIDGIGAYLSIDDNGALEVVKPIEGGPAALAGLRAGDIIVTIDGVDSARFNLSEAASNIRGLHGTVVTLGIYRSITDGTFDISITRGRVEIPTVETEIQDNVFIIKLSTFTKLTPDAFREALKEFVASANAGGPNRLLLDLRGNTGGILSIAVYIAGIFLPEDSPVLYEYSGTEKLRVYRTNKPAFKNSVIPTMTMVVDGATASASEILAAALRHYDIADIVGTQTLGKGSVQAIKSVGEEALLKITIAHWLTPAKESIGNIGIAPDVDYEKEIKEILRGDSETDISKFVLKKAIQHLKNK